MMHEEMLAAYHNGSDEISFGEQFRKSAVMSVGAKKAGQMAVAGALATIGGHMAKDYMTQGESKKKSDAK
jgi:hypothetical protein